MTAIFTPGSEGRSFQSSSDGSSMMCSACWAAACKLKRLHAPNRMSPNAPYLMRCSLNGLPVCQYEGDASAGERPALASGRAASARLRKISFAHQLLHDHLADLPAHILTDAGREPVMKAGIDAGKRHLVRVGPHIGPAMRHARSRRAGHGDLWNVGAAE